MLRSRLGRGPAIVGIVRDRHLVVLRLGAARHLREEQPAVEMLAVDEALPLHLEGQVVDRRPLAARARTDARLAAKALGARGDQRARAVLALAHQPREPPRQPLARPREALLRARAAAARATASLCARAFSERR
eukprot:3114840-Prymnesium_polylepis.1